MKHKSCIHLEEQRTTQLSIFSRDLLKFLCFTDFAIIVEFSHLGLFLMNYNG